MVEPGGCDRKHFDPVFVDQKRILVGSVARPAVIDDSETARRDLIRDAVVEQNHVHVEAKRAHIRRELFRGFLESEKDSGLVIVGSAPDQEFQGEERLSASCRAADDRRTTLRETASRDLVQAGNPARSFRKRSRRGPRTLRRHHLELPSGERPLSRPVTPESILRDRGRCAPHRDAGWLLTRIGLARRLAPAKQKGKNHASCQTVVRAFEEVLREEVFRQEDVGLVEIHEKASCRKARPREDAHRHLLRPP